MLQQMTHNVELFYILYYGSSSLQRTVRKAAAARKAQRPR